MGSSSSEEAAELVATIRGEHVVMKKWFNDNPSEEAAALRNKYGVYPGLWKEVLNWAGWKDARKSYLKHTQGATSSSSSPPIEQNSSEQQQPPRKRRSRWGNTENNSNENNDGGAAATKRRSRWGRDDASTTATSSATGQAPATSMSGHYGPSGGGGHGGAMNMKSIPGLGLPGMPTNLTPDQQKEMGGLQGRLRDINVRLDNLEGEAARVDALPRGHRERSQSPPPGK